MSIWIIGLFSMVIGAFASETPQDVSQNLTRGQCTKFPMPGADQYYLGHWTMSADGKVTGTEKRVLYANSKWKRTIGPDKKRGGDCEVVWNVSGVKKEVGACTFCSFSVAFQAQVDYEKSTCPQRIVNDGAYRSGHYDIHHQSDGVAAIYSHKTGKKLATGFVSTDQWNYRTDHTCVWF